MTVQELTDNNFTQEVSKKNAIVKFSAPWCAPCKQLLPILEDVSEEFSDSFNFFKINIDETQKTATQHQIRSVPTLLIFKNGKVVDRQIGSLPKTKIVDWLKKHV